MSLLVLLVLWFKFLCGCGLGFGLVCVGALRLLWWGVVLALVLWDLECFGFSWLLEG